MSTIKPVVLNSNLMIPYFTHNPSLNTQSCIRGLLWYEISVGGRLWATLEGGFFMFSRSKKIWIFFWKHYSVCTKKLHNIFFKFLMFQVLFYFIITCKVILQKWFQFIFLFSYKVHIFWEGHKILRNLHQLFVLCTAKILWPS